MFTRDASIRSLSNIFRSYLYRVIGMTRIRRSAGLIAFDDLKHRTPSQIKGISDVSSNHAIGDKWVNLITLIGKALSWMIIFGYLW